MGRRLGNYQVRALIGCGAMGAVYLAHDAVLDRPIALKVLLGSLAKSPEQLRRFQREARAAAPLSHPNIVRIYEAGVREGIPFIAMEYVDGESFDHLLSRAGLIPWRRALEIAGQMARALDCAHEHGVVHRDVKPSNMLIDKAGRLRLTDFGIARVRDQSTGLTEHDLFIGTPEFMSPEQCVGSEEIGPKTDLFSLGVTLYRMISGRMPFSGFNTAALIASITRETPIRLNRILPDVPDDVARLVAHLLEKDPAARPESAEVVASTIDALLENDGGASAMSAALDAFIRDQAKPRQIEVWNTPTPPDKAKGKDKNKKRAPAIRQTRRRQFYVPVSGMARFAAAGILAFALLGAGYWYLASPREIVQAAPLIDKAVFAARQPGVYRMEMPARLWEVGEIHWAPRGETLLVALCGRADSTLHGAEGLVSISPTDGAIRSVIPPSAPWRGEHPASLSLLQTGLSLLAARPVGQHPLAEDGFLLRVFPFGNAGQYALARHPVAGDAALRTPLALLPLSAGSEKLRIVSSPDAATLAIALPTGTDSGYQISLRTADAGPSSPGRDLLTAPVALNPASLTFTPDATHLLFIGDTGLGRGIYRISLDAATRVERVAPGDYSPPIAVHPSGSHLVASKAGAESEEQYRVPLQATGSPERITTGRIGAQPFVHGGAALLATQVDPGASQLVIVSDHPGSASIVIAEFESTRAGAPEVCPDGKWAASVLHGNDGDALALIDMETAAPSPAMTSAGA